MYKKTEDFLAYYSYFYYICSKIRTMSYKKVRDVIRELERNGFHFVRQTGSHMVYTDGIHVAVVPDHGNKGIEKGTYYSILRQAGIKK